MSHRSQERKFSQGRAKQPIRSLQRQSERVTLVISNLARSSGTDEPDTEPNLNSETEKINQISTASTGSSTSLGNNTFTDYSHSRLDHHELAGKGGI